VYEKTEDPCDGVKEKQILGCPLSKKANGEKNSRFGREKSHPQPCIVLLTQQGTAVCISLPSKVLNGQRG